MQVSGKYLKSIYDELFRHYGDLSCPLNHESSFQLTVAVVLSAQCRDDRVNLVTAKLFEKYPTPEAMAEATAAEIAPYLQQLGLYQAKAKYLHGIAEKIVCDFGGEVPKSMAELLTLPGVGRKSANVILGNGFGIPGFPVDTHVRRLAGRLGLSKHTAPEKIEADIIGKITSEYWTNFSNLLIHHGRQCCNARKPECEKCFLKNYCLERSAGMKKTSKVKNK